MAKERILESFFKNQDSTMRGDLSKIVLLFINRQICFLRRSLSSVMLNEQCAYILERHKIFIILTSQNKGQETI